MMYNVLYVYLLSLIPSFEGRYALVVGVALGINPVLSFLIACLGVLTLSLLLPMILPFIDRIMYKFSETRRSFLAKIGAFYLRYIEKTRKKASKYVEKYGFIGLIVFVAIPLPATGVWTGALASYIFGMRRETAICGLIIGGMISNLIVFIASYILKSCFF